jgi:hypothetical protein
MRQLSVIEQTIYEMLMSELDNKNKALVEALITSILAGGQSFAYVAPSDPKPPRSNPGVSEYFDHRRKTQKFLIRSREYDDFHVLGYEALAELTGKKVAYLRQRLANGKGETQLSVYNTETKFHEYWTITRLEKILGPPSAALELPK